MLNYVVGGLALYGLAVGGLYVMQDSMIFPRQSAVDPKYPLPAHSERMSLITPDGHQIVGNLVRSLGPSKGLILGFSGNAWNADDCTVFLEHRVKDYDIAVFHYRGYAPSNGKPGEAEFFADAKLIYDTLVVSMSPDRVIPVGFSIGSGVATYLAANRDVDGVLLVTPFDSIQAIAQKKHRWAPVKPLLKHPFRSDLYVEDLEIPIAVIRASDDNVVPAAHTDVLVTKINHLVYDHTIDDSTHGGIYDMEEIDTEIVRAIEALSSQPTLVEPEVKS